MTNGPSRRLFGCTVLSGRFVSARFSAYTIRVGKTFYVVSRSGKQETK